VTSLPCNWHTPRRTPNPPDRQAQPQIAAPHGRPCHSSGLRLEVPDWLTRSEPGLHAAQRACSARLKALPVPRYQSTVPRVPPCTRVWQ
jgi:hypothetical protein